MNRELLSAPIRLAISNDHPSQWPAWNMDFDQEQAPPRAYVRGGQRAHQRERPGARRRGSDPHNTEGSHFVQTVSLSAGDAGNRVEFGNVIDWKTLYANLKATFPLAATNDDATYNWGFGTVQRPNCHRAPVRSGFPSVDRPHRPERRLRRDHPHRLQERLRQAQRQHHSPDAAALARASTTAIPTRPTRIGATTNSLFGIAGHRGDWRDGQTDWQGYRLNQPLIAFEPAKHAGSLGKSSRW